MIAQRGAVRVTYPRMVADDVRAMLFRSAPWWRGVDAAEVYAFLARVADEMDVLERDLAVARAETDRVKAAMRDWQTRNARQPHRR